jgi:MFS family permease
LSCCSWWQERGRWLFSSKGNCPQLGLIYVAVLGVSCCSQFFNPARGVLIAEIVEPQDQARASGLSQTTANLALILGPPLAAPLLFALGVQWALIMDALSFVVSYLTIQAIHPPQQAGQAAGAAEEGGKFWRELREGIRFYFRSQALTTILIAACIVTLGSGVLNALDVFFVTQNLHAQPDLYGLLGMAFGTGSITGALLSAFFLQSIGEVRAFWGGLGLSGLLVLIFARLTSLWPGLVLFFFFGFSVAVVNTVIGPLVLRVTPHHLLGRVFSIFSPLVNLVGLLSLALAGYLASLLHDWHSVILGVAIGSYDTLFTGAGLLLVIASGSVFMSLHRQPELKPVPEPETALAAPQQQIDVVGYADEP